jgi:DNA (cytosine-5)-methyltransferase 1
MTRKSKSFTFIDLFAGCGGLSLGLMQSGWQGKFAIEKNSDAFKTLKHNLVDENAWSPSHFDWPNWLEIKEMSTGSFIRKHEKQVKKLAGQVPLLVGGPPCQGFSLTGKRRHGDSRNKLYLEYLKILNLVQPSLVLVENVPGFSSSHNEKLTKKRNIKRASFASLLKKKLEGNGYSVQQGLVDASQFGVPQIRVRHITFAVKLKCLKSDVTPNFFEILESERSNFLHSLGLSLKKVTASQAISDLVKDGHNLIECSDPYLRKGFQEIEYKGPRTKYQKLMHQNMNNSDPPNSMRLANHYKETKTKFKKILKCKKGVSLSDADRQRLGIRKYRITPLCQNSPAATLTTCPEDTLHYSEPRIHSVREHARFQSFPDWFAFQGKFTTGGLRRVFECPRYTQVGNAVPPLLAKAMGVALKKYLKHLV